MEWDFLDFMKNIGFNKNQTRIETYRLDGTNNYLIGLNSAGMTWAVSIRIPAMGVEHSKIENEKTIAVNTAKFMVEKLSARTQISDNVSFLFDGMSCLASSNSVLDFFNYQNSLSPLVIIENITTMKAKKIIEGKRYPDNIDEDPNLSYDRKKEIKRHFSSYTGLFFVSKGAPASETLYTYIDLALEAANSLSVLHSKTGLKELMPIEIVISIAYEFDKKLNELSYSDFSFEPTAQDSFEKYEDKWNKNKNQDISRLVRKEIILRTKLGKNILTKLLFELEDQMQNSSKYKCFTHNDPHSENFIVVEYLYEYEQKNHEYVDREFLNSIYRNSNEVIDRLTIEYINDENTLLYREYMDSDVGKHSVNIVRRSLSYDLHLIDIDDATGIKVETMKSYLNDLLIYSISISNIGLIKGKIIKIEDVISSYYNFFIKH